MLQKNKNVIQRVLVRVVLCRPQPRAGYYFQREGKKDRLALALPFFSSSVSSGPVGYPQVFLTDAFSHKDLKRPHIQMKNINVKHTKTR